MINVGERGRQVVEQDVARARYIAEIEEIGKSYKKRHDKLLAEKKKLEHPGNLKNLTVSWEQDGEVITIGPLKDATPGEFLRAVDSIPRSIKVKLDGGRLRRLEEIRGEVNRIPREYRERKKLLETRIYHCEARIAQLQEGAPS